MKKALFLALFFLSYLVVGYEVTDISVTENQKAQIEVRGSLGSELPDWKITNNTIDLVFSKTSLSTKFGDKKIELSSPHVLLKSVTAISDGQSVKMKLMLNGSLENLKERFQVIPSESGLLLSLDYPVKNASSLKMMQEEQAPIADLNKKAQKSEGASYSAIITVISSFLVFTLVLGLGFTRYMKRKGGLRGSRKYLVEQLSFVPMGPKSGVSLLRVGKEFILVGVTPQNISTLSHLPRLQQEYEEETGFERGVFKESVAEEIQKLRVA